MSEYVHYADHLLPILAALPDERRGWLYAPPQLRQQLAHVERLQIGPPPPGDEPILVAGYQDLHVGQRRPRVLVSHGADQTYRDVDSPSYAGGPGRELADLFLCPNEASVRKNLQRYPNARAVAVGCPKLDTYRRVPRPRNDRPVVAVTFHWPCSVTVESGWAWPTWQTIIPQLAEHYTLVGHHHPRARPHIGDYWESIGVEYVADPCELLRRADLLVADNTSFMYEWAACDRPVVAIDDLSWRTHIDHGLRFWSHVPGLRVRAGEGLDGLLFAIDTSLACESAHDLGLLRRKVTVDVYGAFPAGMAHVAARAVLDLEEQRDAA